MSSEQAGGIVAALRHGRSFASKKAMTEALRTVDLTERLGTATLLAAGVLQTELEPPPGVDHASLTTVDGQPASVIFFIASDPHPASMMTKAACETLLTSLSAILGSPVRVWADRPNPVSWSEAGIDFGMQLFDRRDSTVMVWIEHHSRSLVAEERALKNVQ